VSGVAAADQRRVAERLAKARNAYILTARGTEQHASGSDTVSAWINLALALGLPGREGSGYGCLTGQGNGQGGREHDQKADQLPGYRKIDEEALRYDVLEPAAANVWVAPAASVRTCTRGESGSPGRGRAYSGSTAIAIAKISTWSAAVLDPAFPGRRIPASASPPATSGRSR
jgi:anaerobic selenocysteine-containing dehydrogenase